MIGVDKHISKAGNFFKKTVEYVLTVGEIEQPEQQVARERGVVRKEETRRRSREGQAKHQKEKEK